MGNFMIITDTNSNIMPKDAVELGIETVTMPFNIDGDEYMDGVDLTNEEFYQKMQAGADIKTSQPSQFYLEEMWERILKEYDEILYIPTSSGLSGTCENAKIYAEKYNGKIHIVDNHRISVFLKESVYHAIALKKQGKSAKEIKEILSNKEKLNNMKEAICKVCNHTTYYDNTDVYIGDNGIWYILCDHCMNEIIIGEEK